MEQVFYIDLKDITTKKSLHEAIAGELPLPDYYGGNLDALYDVLTEQGEDWNIIFYNTNALGKEPSQSSEAEDAGEMSKYFSKLKKMCKQAVSECDNLKIRFYP